MQGTERKRARRSPRPGFTLIELLVTVAIVGVLFAILLPALGGVRQRARSFKCQMTLRSLAFDFAVFADDQLRGERGDDSMYGDKFRLETFQESLYGVDEFWKWGRARSAKLTDTSGNDPMRCSEMRGDLFLRRGTSCSGGAVGPAQNISYGFNMRLHRAEVTRRGRVGTAPVLLSTAIADEAMVPLVWDIDGEAARRRNVLPVFSTPSLGSNGPFRNDKLWFPSPRHGPTNVAFVGGHVDASQNPLDEPGWRWGYQPVR